MGHDQYDQVECEQEEKRDAGQTRIVVAVLEQYQDWDQNKKDDNGEYEVVVVYDLAVNLVLLVGVAYLQVI
jgi:hypothetical protein